MAGLTNIVKEKLGLSFEVFAEQIRDDKSYEKLVEQMKAINKDPF